jgi:curved DNA-binding protein
MAFIDYYKILGLDKTASESDIKSAYRKLARKYHPDLNPNDKEAEQKFKEINEANEVLRDPENRKKYDTYGENWKHSEEFEKQQQQQRQYQGSNQQNYSGGFQGGDYSDFFESMFGGRTSGRSGRETRFKGQDLNAELHLDLKEAYTTHKRTLTINGKKISITLPAGIKNGQTIKIAGQGGEGSNGGPKGDLYISFVISNHTKFKLDQDNLYESVDLDLYTALLGGDIMVDTFDGKVKLKVAPETQNGTKVKLKGKGFPVYKKEGHFGDLFITYEIKLPQHLTEKEKELINELAKERVK